MKHTQQNKITIKTTEQRYCKTKLEQYKTTTTTTTPTTRNKSKSKQCCLQNKVIRRSVPLYKYS